MKKILVTGASGFIGKSTIDALKNSPSIDAADVIITERVNLLDTIETEALFKKHQPTHCIHLAWPVPPQTFWHAEENKQWVDASIWIYRCFLKNGGQHFIGAGSTFEYNQKTQNWDENTPPQPMTLYAESKVKTYMKLVEIQKESTIPTVLQWGRIGYFFGENESPKKLLSTLVRKMRKNEPIQLLNESVVRDYGHVCYLGEAFAKLINISESMIINLSGGTRYTLKDIVEMISIQLNYKQTIQYGAYQTPSFEAERVTPNLLRMKNTLGIDPSITFIADLQRFVQNKADHE